MTVEPGYRRALLALARRAIAEALGEPAPPPSTDGASHPILDERRGAFVTLHQRERLRGCIGRVEPDSPLSRLIPDVARAAALADPRFPPLAARELATVVIEISLLSVPERVADVESIDVGHHGLMVASRGRRGLLLPQVAVEFGWSREEFLCEVCAKAGLARDAWRGDGVRLEAFTADVFGEDDA